MLLYSQTLKNINSPSQETLEKAKKAVSEIKEDLYKEGDLKALGIAYEKEDLEEIQEFADFIRNNFKRVIVMGIGGSSLGAKTLCSLKNDCCVTILESIDSNTVKSLLDSLNLEETAFITVSKSGKTIECISQTLLALKKVEEELGKEAFNKHFFFLTEDKESPLTELAKEFDIKVIPHHKTVGGRFSYLSNVGLIPAAIAGLDAGQIRQGAIDVLEYVLNNEDDFISEVCAVQSELFADNVVAKIIMPYVDKLGRLTEWYRQLLAESLGKDNYGVIPVDAMGTVDQHSQLQLYMEGPKDKFYTFILKDKCDKSPKIQSSYNKGFDYLIGKSLDDIMDIEARSTIGVLEKRNLPIRVLNLKTLNERALSQLLMQYILEIIIIGKINDINPFGQMAVEERKILAREMMSRKQ